MTDYLEVEEQCRRLMARTFYFADHHDTDGFVGLFASDGRAVFRGVTAVGIDEIRASFLQRDPERVTRHHLGFPHIEVIDADTARGVGTFVIYDGRHSGDSAVLPLTAPVSLGEIQQTFLRTAEGWRIATHKSVRVFETKSEARQ